MADGLDGPLRLLVCDLELDGLGGREAAILLQARRPEMRALYMSGRDEADFRAELESAEPVFLAKPFDTQAVLAAVEKALAGGRRRAERRRRASA